MQFLTLFALGDIVRAFQAITLVVIFVFGSLVNAVLCLPLGLWLAWKLLPNKRKRIRLIWGLVAATILFIGLWFVELILLIAIAAPSQP